MRVSLLLNAEHRDDNVVLITAEGRIDRTNAQQIPGAVHAAIVRWAPAAVLLDVNAVAAIDPAGVAALLASHHAARKSSVTVAVVNPGDQLYQQIRQHDAADALCPHLAVTSTEPVTAG